MFQEARAALWERHSEGPAADGAAQGGGPSPAAGAGAGAFRHGLGVLYERLAEACSAAGDSDAALKARLKGPACIITAPPPSLSLPPLTSLKVDNITPHTHTYCTTTTNLHTHIHNKCIQTHTLVLYRDRFYHRLGSTN